MVKIPFSKLIAVIWGIILAFFIAKSLIDSAIELADYFAFSAADVISSDLAGRVAVVLGIPGNVTLKYKLPEEISYNLTMVEKVICVVTKGMMYPTYHCKTIPLSLSKEYFFDESGIELTINKTIIDGKYTISVEA